MLKKLTGFQLGVLIIAGFVIAAFAWRQAVPPTTQEVASFRG